MTRETFLEIQAAHDSDKNDKLVEIGMALRRHGYHPQPEVGMPGHHVFKSEATSMDTSRKLHSSLTQDHGLVHRGDKYTIHRDESETNHYEHPKGIRVKVNRANDGGRSIAHVEHDD